MAYVQSDLDNIRAAIATGAKEVTYADNRRVVYRSLAEMQSIRDEIEAEVSGRGGSLKDNRVVTGYAGNLARRAIGR